MFWVAHNKKSGRWSVHPHSPGLVEWASLHRNYVGGIERGERNVGLDKLHALAKALGVHPSALFLPE